MQICIGIDSSLNSTGICTYFGDPAIGILPPQFQILIPPKNLDNQMLKILWQRDGIESYISSRAPDFLAIEVPYQLPFRARGAGGQQSSNLYALYSLVIDIARERKLPIACFHISQLRSLIHGEGGTSKKDTIARAYEDGAHPLPIDPFDRKLTDHEADAYFIAKYGRIFWKLFEREYYLLPPSKYKIFHSLELTAKKRPQGMLYRPGDAWFDFRRINPLEGPTWLDLPLLKQSST